MTSQTVGATDTLVRPLEEQVLARPVRSLWGNAFRQFRRHRLAMFGLVMFTLLLVGAFVGPFVYTTPVDDIDMANRLDGPSRTHPLGTDNLGQDLLARVLYGGRISMAVGMLAMV